MAFTAYRTFVAGEIVTAAMLNQQIRDNGNYLKGVGQVPTIQSGLTIDNSLGSERLLLPLLSTAECATVLNAAGEVAYDEATNRIKMYGAALNSVVTTADVDDTPVDAATTDPISSNWAYDHLGLLTTAGDVIYATAAGTWARLGIGTAGQRLRTNAGATAPEWAATGLTQEFAIIMSSDPALAAAVSQQGTFTCMNPIAGESVYFRPFKVPADFVTLTNVKVACIKATDGNVDWTVNTNFGAAGEAYTTHTGSATAVGVAMLTTLIYEIDCSAAFTGLVAGDLVGMTFKLDVISAGALHVIGATFKYT